MLCKKIIKLLPDFIDGVLSAKDKELVSIHLEVCDKCLYQKKLYEESWKLLGSIPEISPEPGFKTRFWSRVVNEANAKTVFGLQVFNLHRRLSALAATLATIIIVSSLTLPNYLKTQAAIHLAENINEDEVVLVDNIDLLENFDLINNIDLLEDMELFENLQTYELDSA